VNNFPIWAGWLGQNSSKKTEATTTHPAAAETHPVFRAGDNRFKSFDIFNKRNKSRIKTRPYTDIQRSGVGDTGSGNGITITGGPTLLIPATTSGNKITFLVNRNKSNNNRDNGIGVQGGNGSNPSKHVVMGTISNNNFNGIACRKLPTPESFVLVTMIWAHDNETPKSKNATTSAERKRYCANDERLRNFFIVRFSFVVLMRVPPFFRTSHTLETKVRLVTRSILLSSVTPAVCVFYCVDARASIIVSTVLA
jgi:hypothetical protein